MDAQYAQHARLGAPNARRARATFCAALLAGALSALTPTTSRAAVVTFGSPLSVPATLNTTEGLGYRGTDTTVPPSREAPNGIVHTAHFGSDTAIWNEASAGGPTGAPSTGQALKVRLEGCAQPAAGGPPPLTQIHLQDLSPMPNGGAKVNLTSQPFDMPVCGQGGATASTVTTYEPINLCVSQGDYVAFDDEGGFVEPYYRSGVSYQVLGSVPGSGANSFIRANGTGNGAVLSALDGTNMDGFASNPNEELMLQVLLGTGSDATHICAGGMGGLGPALPPIRVSPQTDGVNHAGIVSVAVFCRQTPRCDGVLTLTATGGRVSYGHVSFSLTPKKTEHVAIRVAARAIALLRKSRGGVRTTLSAVVAGKSVTQTIVLKIY